MSNRPQGDYNKRPLLPDSKLSIQENIDQITITVSSEIIEKTITEKRLQGWKYKNHIKIGINETILIFEK
jgi:hypothetical protein